MSTIHDFADGDVITVVNDDPRFSRHNGVSATIVSRSDDAICRAVGAELMVTPHSPLNDGSTVPFFFVSPDHVRHAETLPVEPRFDVGDSVRVVGDVVGGFSGATRVTDAAIGTVIREYDAKQDVYAVEFDSDYLPLGGNNTFLSDSGWFVPARQLEGVAFVDDSETENADDEISVSLTREGWLYLRRAALAHVDPIEGDGDTWAEVDGAITEALNV